MFLIKYWKLILPVVLSVVFLIWFNGQISKARQEAQSALLEQIEKQAETQIKADIETVKEAFETNPAINDIVDNILSRESENETDITSPAIVEPSSLQPDKDSDESRLFSTESVSTIPNKRDDKGDDSVRDADGLRDYEIDFIREYSGILQ